MKNYMLGWLEALKCLVTPHHGYQTFRSGGFNRIGSALFTLMVVFGSLFMALAGVLYREPVQTEEKEFNFDEWQKSRRKL